jgi:hypothetical protein
MSEPISPSNSPEEPNPLTSPLAEGSGAAAILAFTHIGLVGVLGFGSFFLLTNPAPALILSPLLIWQFFLPAFLGLILFFPTDPLTRVLAVTARCSGFGALICLSLAFVFSLFHTPLENDPVVPRGVFQGIIILLTHLSAAWLAALCFGEAVHSRMLGYNSTSLSNFSRGLATRTTLVLVIVSIAAHLRFDPAGSGSTFINGLIAMVGIFSCRLAAYVGIRTVLGRPGAHPSYYSPSMTAAGLSILILSQQAPMSAPALSAIFVAFAVWSLLPRVSSLMLPRISQDSHGS